MLEFRLQSVREGRPGVLTTPAHPVKPEFILKESGGEIPPSHLPSIIPSTAPAQIVPSRGTPPPCMLRIQGMAVTSPENPDGTVSGICKKKKKVVIKSFA